MGLFRRREPKFPSLVPLPRMAENAKAAASVPELDQWVSTISKMSRGK